MFCPVLGGAALTIHSYDLTGGTAGTDGFLGPGASGLSGGNSDWWCNGRYIRSGKQRLPGNQHRRFDFAFAGKSVRGYRSPRCCFRTLPALIKLPPALRVGNSAFGAALGNFTAQVNSALGGLGADNNNIQLQITFVQSLSDASNDGLGNLVDANLAKCQRAVDRLAGHSNSWRRKRCRSQIRSHRIS